MAVKRYSGTSWVTEAGAAAPLPSGMLAPFAGAAAPTGWLLCTGGTFSATAYPQLAAVLGDTYGVHSGDNYYLPDLRGRTVAGLDNMGGTAANRITSTSMSATGAATVLGNAGGDERLHQHSHSNTLSDPGHGHSWSGQNSSLNNNGQAGNYPFKIAQDLQTQWTGTTANIGAAGTGMSINNVNAGSGTAQNLPPTIVLNYIIKV